MTELDPVTAGIVRDLARRVLDHEDRIRSLARGSQARHRSVEGGAQSVYDEDDELRAIVGQLEDGTYGITTYGGEAPVAPSVPLVTAIPGGATITWDGFDANDEQGWPDNFARVRIHQSTIPGDPPDTENTIGTFDSPAGGALTIAHPADVTTFVYFVAVTTAGVESAPSAEAEVVGGDPGAGAEGMSAYDVAVANGFVGTEAEWLASLEGAAGDPGDPGAPGDPGPAGDPGDPGPSAYDLAVAGGFVGTEAEWLASLEAALPPPATSPLPEVLTGSGSAAIRWDHVEGATHYTLHAVTQPLEPAGPPDGTTVHTLNASSPMFVYDVPLDADTWFALEAHGLDPTEDPAPSAWVAGRAAPIVETIMRASLAVVQELVAELVETQGLNIGTGSWTADEGLDIPGVVKFPVDGVTDVAELIAAVTARRLTVSNNFSLSGLINSITQGSELVLDTGPVAPADPPTVVNAWAKDGQIDWYGTLVAAFVRIQTGETVHCRGAWEGISPGYIVRLVDGVVTSQISIGYFEPTGMCFVSTDDAAIGEAGDVGNFLIVARQTTSGDWFILKCSSSFTGWTTHRLGGPSFFTQNAGIFDWNNTNYGLVGWKNDGGLALYIPTIADPGTAGTRWDFTGFSNPFDIQGLSGPVGVPGGTSATDVDDPNTILMWRSTNDALAFDQTSMAYTPARNVPRAKGRAIQAAQGYYSVDTGGEVWEYSFTRHAGDLAFSWVDNDTGGTGKHETPLSPPAPIAGLSRGAEIGFIIPPVADSGDDDSPNEAWIYGRKTAVAAWRFQAATAGTEGELAWLVDFTALWGTLATFAAANLDAARIRSAASLAGYGYLIDLIGDGAAPMIRNLRHTVPHFRGYRNAALTVVNATWVRVPFNTTLSSEQVGLTNSGGTWTCQRKGLYRAKAQVRWATVTTGRRNIAIYKNGVNIAEQGVPVAALISANAGQSLDKTLDLAVGDTVEIYVWQNNGTTSIDVTGGSEVDTFGELVYLGEKA